MVDQAGSLLGSDAVRQLVAHECQSVIIGCSANSQTHHVHQGFLDAGAAACWPKPLPALAEIRAQLRELLPFRLPGLVRVLIVDDSPLACMVLTQWLGTVCPPSWEYAVEASASVMLQTMGFEPPPPGAAQEDSKDGRAGGLLRGLRAGRPALILCAVVATCAVRMW